MTRLVFLNDELVTVCRVVNPLEVEMFKVLCVVGLLEVEVVILMVVTVVKVVVVTVVVGIEIVVMVVVVLIIFLSLQPPLTVSN